jgi:hypothetical protein
MRCFPFGLVIWSLVFAVVLICVQLYARKNRVNCRHLQTRVALLAVKCYMYVINMNCSNGGELVLRCSRIGVVSLKIKKG